MDQVVELHLETTLNFNIEGDLHNILGLGAGTPIWYFYGIPGTYTHILQGDTQQWYRFDLLPWILEGQHNLTKSSIESQFRVLYPQEKRYQGEPIFVESLQQGLILGIH